MMASVRLCHSACAARGTAPSSARQVSRAAKRITIKRVHLSVVDSGQGYYAEPLRGRGRSPSRARSARECAHAGRCGSRARSATAQCNRALAGHVGSRACRSARAARGRARASRKCAQRRQIFRGLSRTREDILRDFFRGRPDPMWFKNLALYRLPADWNVSAAELEEKLGQRTLQPCSPLEMLSRGWVAPSEHRPHAAHGESAAPHRARRRSEAAARVHHPPGDCEARCSARRQSGLPCRAAARCAI